MPDPTYYPTTTIDASPAAVACEGPAVGDMSKDWTISLLEERLESRIIITKKLEAEVRSLDSGRIDREYQINRLKGEVDDARDVAIKLADEKNELRKENRSLRAELAKRDETIAKLREDRDTIQRDYSTACFERDKDLASLRTQLTRAGAIEYKCPHCGRPTEPINLTCGGCGEWLSKPAAKPAEQRLAILERVAKEAKAVARAYNLGGMITPMGNLIDALAELDKLEATQCPIP